MSLLPIDVHEYNDDTWKGCVTAKTASELLAEHVWTTYVAGVQYHESASWCEVGSLLRLVREPENPRDPNAVAVWTDDGLMAGYIPRSIAADVDSTIDRGAIALAEMRVDGHRIGMWILVSRVPIVLRITPALAAAGHRLKHRVDHMKELALASIEPWAEHLDPIVAMRLMADALDHEHNRTDN